MPDRILYPDSSFIPVFIYLFVYFIVEVRESSTTVPSTTVSGGE